MAVQNLLDAKGGIWVRALVDNPIVANQVMNGKPSVKYPYDDFVAIEWQFVVLSVGCRLSCASPQKSTTIGRETFIESCFVCPNRI